MFEIKINGLQELEKKIARTISGMPEAARRGVEKGLKTTAGIAIRLAPGVVANPSNLKSSTPMGMKWRAGCSLTRPLHLLRLMLSSEPA